MQFLYCCWDTKILPWSFTAAQNAYQRNFPWIFTQIPHFLELFFQNFSHKALLAFLLPVDGPDYFSGTSQWRTVVRQHHVSVTSVVVSRHCIVIFISCVCTLYYYRFECLLRLWICDKVPWGSAQNSIQENDSPQIEQNCSIWKIRQLSIKNKK
jgi:hypothetical protein